MVHFQNAPEASEAVWGDYGTPQDLLCAVPQRKKISDQTQVTGRFLGGQGLDETRNQARRAFVLTHLETWCQVNFL